MVVPEKKLGVLSNKYSKTGCNFSMGPIQEMVVLGAPIHIFELEALSANVNVASRGTATQSSDLSSKYIASNAINGNKKHFQPHKILRCLDRS